MAGVLFMFLNSYRNEVRTKKVAENPHLVGKNCKLDDLLLQVHAQSYAKAQDSLDSTVT